MLTRDAIVAAGKKAPPQTHFVWDGQDEDDRPATAEELAGAVNAWRKKRGRPIGSDKTSTTLRLDNDVLDAFKADGSGWQTRINAALREWLERHGADGMR